LPREVIQIRAQATRSTGQNAPRDALGGPRLTDYREPGGDYFERRRDPDREITRAASRSKGTCLGERYRRLPRRRGDKKAIIAIAHEILAASWHMLNTGEVYREQGPRSSPSATPTTPAAAPSASSNASATRSPSDRLGEAA
jgi:hypothetical protein